MQVKKYEATSVLDALRLVKEDMGPDAIILSTQESKKSIAGGRRFTVVAAISENQYRKKELAAQSLGSIYDSKVKTQPARQQKTLLDNVYKGLEDRWQQKQRMPTTTPYIQIADENEPESNELIVKPVANLASTPTSSQERVKMAARAALKSSLSSDLFASPKATEPEMSPHPVSSAQWPKAIEEIFLRLKRSGIDPELNQSLRDQAMTQLGKNSSRKAMVDSWYAKKILGEIHVSAESSNKKIEILVGPQGAGKTTSMIKIATDYVVNQSKKLAIVTTDLHKVGAVEQTRTYCRILNIPLFVVNSTLELSELLAGLGGFDKIIVDTPGISLSHIGDLDLMRPLGQIKNQFSCSVHLVLSALTKNTDLGGLLKRFRVADYDDIIITNIDQTSQHGILININQYTDKPYHSFGISADVIDGFEYATRERVLDLIFKLTQKKQHREMESGI
jgi:flagellar biosynthesis protein FlhF